MTADVPNWLPRERRALPDLSESIALIAKQNEVIALQIEEAMKVAREANSAAVDNKDSLAHLAECYEKHVCDTAWLPEMRQELTSLIEAMRFILTLQKFAAWLSKALAGLLALIVAVIGISDYLVPWLSAFLNAHKPPPP